MKSQLTGCRKAVAEGQRCESELKIALEAELEHNKQDVVYYMKQLETCSQQLVEKCLKITNTENQAVEE